MFAVQGMVHSTYRNVTQDGQQDVDEEVGIASTLEEHTQRRQEDGEDDLEDVAVSELASCTLSHHPLRK
jgi:hypothetical protein